MNRIRVRLRLLLLVCLSLCALAVSACPVCRPKVQAGIHTEAYSANLLLVLLPVALLLAGGVGLFFVADIRHRLNPRA